MAKLSRMPVTFVFIPFLGMFVLGWILGSSGPLSTLGAAHRTDVVTVAEPYAAEPTLLAKMNTKLSQSANTDSETKPTSFKGTVPGTPNVISDDKHTTAAIKENGVCSLLSEKLGVPFSVSYLWITHFLDILGASQHPEDPNFLHKNWMTSLLASLSPEMLQKGVRARPSAEAFQRVLDIVHKRILDPKSFPPLKVAVVGGSVTQGGGCTTPPVVVEGYKATTRDVTGCAWPKRLELMLNKLAGADIVKVYNLAVGGTNLELATPLIKYWLYPEFLLPDGPDVIISSYSTNEQHTWPYRIDTTNSTTFADEKRRRVNNFISAVHNAKPCDKPPFTVFLDDYLGNQQDRILGETTYNKIVTELAEWYGDVMHVSYADVVRRVVYANTNETIFTPPWPIEISGELAGQTKVEPHFGMGGHVTIAWTLVFAIAQVISGFCENEMFVREMERTGRQSMIPKSVLKMMKEVPPPRLMTDLMLSNVTQAWRDMADNVQSMKATCSDETFGKAPCSFAFIAGPAGTVRNKVQLQHYINNFVVENKGWGPVVDIAAGGWSRKLGLVANSAGAFLTLRVTNITKEVRMLNLQTLKSYGKKWEGSKAQFTLEVENPGKAKWTHAFVIEGFHDSQTR